MDETPFRHIHPVECDWMICYDYRSLEFDTTLIQAYSKITLIAWSMGVWAASQVMKQYPSLPVSQSTAINGTLYPIHETEGITPSVFEGTLQGLNEQTLLKFQRRMCGSAADYKVFQTMAPKRPVEELKEELAAIQQRFYANSPLVEALPAGSLPKTASVAGTARAQVGVAYHAEARMIIAIGAIDNLGKGAAGQAVQCANIIFGLDQTEGLTSLAVGV